MLAKTAMSVLELHIRRDSSLLRNSNRSISVALLAVNLLLPTQTLSVPPIHNDILMSHSSQMCCLKIIVIKKCRHSVLQASSITLHRKYHHDVLHLRLKVFDYFMYCPFVLCKMPLFTSLMITLPARVFDSFNNFPLVLSKISLLSCLIVALPARVF